MQREAMVAYIGRLQRMRWGSAIAHVGEGIENGDIRLHLRVPDGQTDVRSMIRCGGKCRFFF